MAIDIQIPEFSESITEGTISTWIKNVGDKITEGETIVEVETDKVVLEIPAPASGVLEKILKNENDSVTGLEVIGHMSEQEASVDVAKEATAKNEIRGSDNDVDSVGVSASSKTDKETYKKTSPAVRKLMQEEDVDIEDVHASGKNNRVTKNDVMRVAKSSPPSITTHSTETLYSNNTERVPMSGLRKKISDRLVSAQQEYAMLTTFNEVNMQEILAIRSSHKEEFLQKHGVKLGFMSFFVMAAVEALKTYPILNASVEGNDILYHQYANIGVAVSTDRGLVVPVVKGADTKTLSAIEVEIDQLADKARGNKLDIEDLLGGTFTITNGGVFGSMMSTPIINPPQSAILGMHAIEKRPVVINDEIIIAPMMYMALSYDHRIIDGRDAVLFLSHIKKIIENPIHLLLHI